MTVHSEDTHQHSLPALRDVPINVTNLPRLIVLALVRLYQMTFSRMLPQSTCRFYPTCSHYGYQSIFKYGLLRGGWMAFKRILKCQPFHPGGYDPVP